MVYNEKFYLAIVLGIVAVGILVFFIYSFIKKPKSNDFDTIGKKVQPSVQNNKQRSRIFTPVKPVQSTRKVMPGA